jgi:hypothetical protein
MKTGALTPRCEMRMMRAMHAMYGKTYGKMPREA